MTKQAGNRAKWLKPLILAAALAGLAALAVAFDLGEKLGRLKDWIASLGLWGPAVFIIIYALATVAMVPGTVLTFAAGPLFGPLLGVAVVSAGSVLGAALAFLVARYAARSAIEGMLAQNRRFASLDELTRRHGDLVVAITRLVPIFPFNMLNYGLGLTKVSFGRYVFWSWLCMLPATVIYVVGAGAMAEALEKGEVPWSLAAVVAAGAAILAMLVKSARARLKKDAGSNP